MEREGIYKEPVYGFDDKILDELFSEQAPLKIASKGQRLANWLMDHFVMGIIFFWLFALMGGLIGYYEGLNSGGALTAQQDMMVFFFFLGCLSTYVNYYILCEYFLKGKTFGKIITKTKVVMRDGSAPTFRSIIIRSLTRYLPFEVLSFLGSAPDGWHDRLSNTMVVMDTPEKPSEFV